MTTRAEPRAQALDDVSVDKPGNRPDRTTFDDVDTEIDLALLDELSNADDLPDDAFDDPYHDAAPDAAFFLPFRDGRPGWR